MSRQHPNLSSSQRAGRYNGDAKAIVLCVAYNFHERSEFTSFFYFLFYFRKLNEELDNNRNHPAADGTLCDVSPAGIGRLALPAPRGATDDRQLTFWNVVKYHDNHVPTEFSPRKICDNYLHSYTNDVYALTFCVLHDVGCLHFWKHSAISPILTLITSVPRPLWTPWQVLQHHTTRQNVLFPQWKFFFACEKVFFALDMLNETNRASVR